MMYANVVIVCLHLVIKQEQGEVLNNTYELRQVLGASGRESAAILKVIDSFA